MPLSARTSGGRVDQFSYFIVLYSLILGLAVTELLGGFARMVRARALGKIEPQTALLAVLTLICLIATWIDGWNTLQSVTMGFAGLWAPILLAILYYLAAAVVFPHNEADHDRLGDYYRERKRFVIGCLLGAELLIDFTFRAQIQYRFVHQPAVLWLWFVPYNLAIEGTIVALLFVVSRRANTFLLATLILLITIPYWENQMVSRAIERHFGY